MTSMNGQGYSRSFFILAPHPALQHILCSIVELLYRRGYLTSLLRILRPLSQVPPPGQCGFDSEAYIQDTPGDMLKALEQVSIKAHRETLRRPKIDAQLVANTGSEVDIHAGLLGFLPENAAVLRRDMRALDAKGALSISSARLDDSWWWPFDPIELLKEKFLKGTSHSQICGRMTSKLQKEINPSWPFISTHLRSQSSWSLFNGSKSAIRNCPSGNLVLFWDKYKLPFASLGFHEALATLLGTHNPRTWATIELLAHPATMNTTTRSSLSGVDATRSVAVRNLEHSSGRLSSRTDPLDSDISPLESNMERANTNLEPSKINKGELTHPPGTSALTIAYFDAVQKNEALESPMKPVPHPGTIELQPATSRKNPAPEKYTEAQELKCHPCTLPPPKSATPGITYTTRTFLVDFIPATYPYLYTRSPTSGKFQIDFFVFSGPDPPPADIGGAGDVYVAPAARALYAYLPAGGWTRWTVGGNTGRTTLRLRDAGLLGHPYFPDRLLWASDNAFSWYALNSINANRYRTKGDSAEELVARAVKHGQEKRRAGGREDARELQSAVLTAPEQPTETGGGAPDVQPHPCTLPPPKSATPGITCTTRTFLVDFIPGTYPYLYTRSPTSGKFQIDFFVFSGPDPPPADIGGAGDVYVAPAARRLYAYLPAGGWTRWTVGGNTARTTLRLGDAGLLGHPYFPDRLLWASESAFSWYALNSINANRYRTKGETPEELVARTLEHEQEKKRRAEDREDARTRKRPRGGADAQAEKDAEMLIGEKDVMFRGEDHGDGKTRKRRRGGTNAQAEKNEAEMLGGKKEDREDTRTRKRPHGGTDAQGKKDEVKVFDGEKEAGATSGRPEERSDGRSWRSVGTLAGARDRHCAAGGGERRAAGEDREFGGEGEGGAGARARAGGRRQPERVAAPKPERMAAMLYPELMEFMRETFAREVVKTSCARTNRSEAEAAATKGGCVGIVCDPRAHEYRYPAKAQVAILEKYLDDAMEVDAEPQQAARNEEKERAAAEERTQLKAELARAMPIPVLFSILLIMPGPVRSADQDHCAPGEDRERSVLPPPPCFPDLTSPGIPLAVEEDAAARYRAALCIAEAQHRIRELEAKIKGGTDPDHRGTVTIADAQRKIGELEAEVAYLKECGQNETDALRLVLAAREYGEDKNQCA
ncbi:hypothetical protein B0H17DRAFT_1144055 [Mycena rosella]|uniref:Uncharacterized protein n=1 Tax=Mycena rosella TaxID=1033263 RepID=A0AAD7G3C5_MYCRO|nr:hypothetical protein B0H17DRAFT_1144055 [Mycena rosella]